MEWCELCKEWHLTLAPYPCAVDKDGWHMEMWPVTIHLRGNMGEPPRTVREYRPIYMKEFVEIRRARWQA